jgi:hypothetical protein
MIKFILAVAIFAIWGPYLLYVWMYPSEVPVWVHFPGLRRALMLNRFYEPTFFTLLFGIGFTFMPIYGVSKALRGEAPFQQR